MCGFRILDEEVRALGFQGSAVWLVVAQGCSLD